MTPDLENNGNIEAASDFKSDHPGSAPGGMDDVGGQRFSTLSGPAGAEKVLLVFDEIEKGRGSEPGEGKKTQERNWEIVVRKDACEQAASQ